MSSVVSKTILGQLHSYHHALEEQQSSNTSFQTKIQSTLQEIEIRLQEEKKAHKALEEEIVILKRAGDTWARTSSEHQSS